MSKKGFLVFEVGVWIMRILMTLVVIMGIALQIRASINTRANLDFVEPALLLQALVNSPEILYHSSAGTVERIIDLQRFENAGPRLEDSLKFNEPYFAARLAIFSMEIDSKIIYVNKQYYDELSGQKKALFGKNVAESSQQWLVSFIDNGVLRQGVLYAEVLQPK